MTTTTTIAISLSHSANVKEIFKKNKQKREEILEKTYSGVDANQKQTL